MSDYFYSLSFLVNGKFQEKHQYLTLMALTCKKLADEENQ